MSIWSAAVIMGPIIGPALGGWLTENFSWRWVFYINLPIGILAFLGIYLFMARDGGGRQRPFDFLGFGALVTFVGAFQLMIDRGPEPGLVRLHARSGPRPSSPLIGLWVFVVQTLTAEHPFFHRDLAKDRNFVTCTIFGFFVGALLFSTTRAAADVHAEPAGLFGAAERLRQHAARRRLAGRLPARALPDRRASARAACCCIGIALSAVALWQMAHFDLSMTAGPIMTSGLVQGWASACCSRRSTPWPTRPWPRPPHRGHHRQHHGPQPGLQPGHLDHAGDADPRQRRRPRPPGRKDRLCGDPVVRAALPPLIDPATPAASRSLNGEVTRQACDDRLQRHLRHHAALHSVAHPAASAHASAQTASAADGSRPRLGEQRDLWPVANLRAWPRRAAGFRIHAGHALQ